MYLRQLVTTFLILLLVLTAWAEEEQKPTYKLLPKDVYFQPGGGLRVRYENLRGATGAAFTQDEDESQATHRAQIDFKLYKGEYFESFFRFINFADWGSAAGDTSGGQRDGFTRTNGLLVNQAYALWKATESLGLRFGRAPLHFGLGFTYGSNDWFNVPYSFDLFDFSWDWESVKLSLIAAKVQELSTVANQTLSSDPEENHIIINADIKSWSDAIQVFNFNFVQVNRDLGSPDGGLSVQNGLNSQRFSLEFEYVGKQFFSTAYVAFVTGTEKVAQVNQVNSTEEVEQSQSAGDIKLGYMFPQTNKLRFWAGYHFDSGDKIAGDKKSQSFDSFFYEVYGQAGLMDFLRWGNLSFFRVGIDAEILFGFTVGAEFYQFERTQAADGIQFGDAGRFMNSLINNGDITLGNSTDIGQEIDLWMDWQFDSGVRARMTLSSFSPGEVFAQATTTSGASPSSSFFQVLTQVGFFF